MKTGYAHKHAGFTLVELMIVMAVLGLLLAIAVPNYSRARATAQRNTCIKNLTRIDDAKEQWAADNRLGNGVRANRTQINAYLKPSVTPRCPTSGFYRYRPLGTDASCTIVGHSLSSLLDTAPDDDL